MTSLDVASTATSSSPSSKVPPGQITERKSLWRGGTVSIIVPTECRDGTFGDIHFIQFARHVVGGLVNFFVHDSNPEQHKGKTIVAEVELVFKKFADGKSFVHVDLRPTNGKPSHTLDLIYKHFKSSPEKLVFKTPHPLRGAIEISQILTGDGQLDRLISQGWKVQHEDDTTVYCTKGDRQLRHAKPKHKNGRGK